MSLPDIYLLCFSVGAVWAVASLLLGGLHLHLPKLGLHGGHGGHGVGGHGHGHGHPGGHSDGAGIKGLSGLMTALINPSCVAVFLAWFGAAGYLFSRHSKFAVGVVVAIAIVAGNAGAIAIASFL